MLNDALRKTAGRLDTLEQGRATEAPGIWQDFTAGLFQGAVVTATIVFARYELQGKTVRVHARLTATGAGVGGGNTLALTGLPVAPLYHDTPFGLIEVRVAATGIWHSGGARTQAGFGSGQYVFGIVSGVANVIGINPAITLASGDIVSLFGTYEIA